MAGSYVGSYDLGSQSDESYHFERLHIEPIYDAFICPLTKQIMRDPVTLENGQTFEREAIEKWFKECKESGKTLLCPLTLKELRNTEMNPSIALQNTIEEWNARSEAVQLDTTRKSLYLTSLENEIMQSLKDTVRTIVKFLSNKQSKERQEAVSLLSELSKFETLCEKIGSVNGAILILVGMTSSKSENLLTVEKADRSLDNLAKCENNVRQMAENGRLQPFFDTTP
ncbi:hypothetical protein ACSBR2_032509 [Camellia fascicularis]